MKSNAELKTEFETIASEFLALNKKLEDLEQFLSLKMDKKALTEIVSDSRWAAEKCTVIGLHQIGKALEDNNGTGINN